MEAILDNIARKAIVKMLKVYSIFEISSIEKDKLIEEIDYAIEYVSVNYFKDYDEALVFLKETNIAISELLEHAIYKPDKINLIYLANLALELLISKNIEKLRDLTLKYLKEELNYEQI